MRKRVRVYYHELDIPPSRYIETYRWKNLALDLKIIYLWISLTIASLVIPVIATTPLIFIFAIPVLIIIPGYCLTAAYYPDNKAISDRERVSFSIGISVVIVSLMVFFLNYSSWGIQLNPIIIFLIILSVVMGQITQYRRFRLPEEKRFRPLFFDTMNKAGSRDFSWEKSFGYRALNTILLLALVTVICTTIYLIEIPKTGEKFTEFYILGENGTATDYPTDILGGNPGKILIGIANHEYQNTTYVVELWLTNATFNTATNTSIINEMEKLDTFPVTLGHNETYLELHEFIPTDTGFNQMTILLFKDGAPSDTLTGSQRISSSYRKLRLWITVRSPFELIP